MQAPRYHDDPLTQTPFAIMIDARIVPVTPFEQNCSIIWCDKTRKAAVVDPGGDLDRIHAAADKLGVTIEKILITHGHIDHAGGTAKLARELGVPVEGPQDGPAGGDLGGRPPLGRPARLVPEPRGEQPFGPPGPLRPGGRGRRGDGVEQLERALEMLPGGLELGPGLQRRELGRGFGEEGGNGLLHAGKEKDGPAGSPSFTERVFLTGRRARRGPPWSHQALAALDFSAAWACWTRPANAAASAMAISES